MTVPWKTWCRLCASPNGGVSVLEAGGDEQFLIDKIRKYVSISIFEEEKMPCLLCSSCCDQLAAFDNFVHRCSQVQAMFSTLCELSENEMDEIRLTQIRQDFLSTTFNEVLETPPMKDYFPGDKRLETESDKPLCENIADQKFDRRKLRSSSKNKNRADLQHPSKLDDRRKSGRLKQMAEAKRAFAENKKTYTCHSEEDSEGEILESFMMNPSNTFTIKEKSGSSQNNTTESRLICSIPADMNLVNVDEKSRISSENTRLSSDVPVVSQERSKVESKEKPLDIRDETGAKLKNSIHGDEVNCDVLSSDVNCGSLNSLSDADINDLIIDEDDGGTVDDLTVEDFKVNGSWKIDCAKEEQLVKQSDQLKNQVYSLDDMLDVDDEEEDIEDEEEEDEDEEDQEEENHVDNIDWTVASQEKKAPKVRKKTKSTNPPPFKCDKCDKSFHRRALLNVHLTSHVPKDQQPFVCCKCARRFHCESLLRNHERVHLPKEERLVYPCHVCSKKFSSRSAVSAHLRAIHFGERPFVCHLCGNSFTSKGILQEHLTIHSDDTPWHCGKCSKRFKTKYRLKIHMDTHRETPYNCPHCPIQLSTRRTLRMHLVVHRDTKAYQCSTCGKAFRRAKDLKNHFNLHTGRRPYTCPFCSRTFANGSNCRSHKRRMHPEELRLYEAALAANGGIDPLTTTNNALEATDAGNNNLIGHQELDEDNSQSMKEDSQDTLLTEMALDLQQEPQMLTVKSTLPAVSEDPVVTTAADLSLALPLTLTSTLPKLEPDDSRLVMNLTTQMSNSHDSMNAMSPLNLNIMSPLNLNISTVLPSSPGRHHQHTVPVPLVSQHHQPTNGRFHQTANHQPQQITMQPTQHQQPLPHPQQHTQHHLTHQPQQMQPQMHQQQLPRPSIHIANLQTPHSSPHVNVVQVLTSQSQLPAHHNHLSHHAPQPQNFVTNSQQGSTLYGLTTAHTGHVQDPMSPAALMAAAAMAHSMVSATGNGNSTVPAFPGNPYVHHSMAYGRGGGM